MAPENGGFPVGLSENLEVYFQVPMLVSGSVFLSQMLARLGQPGNHRGATTGPQIQYLPENIILWWSFFRGQTNMGVSLNGGTPQKKTK